MYETVMEFNRGPFLVTGAAGYVGSHLTQLLASKGTRVRALVRTKSSGDKLLDPNVEVVTGDLTDERSIQRAVNGVRGIFHIAAIFRQAGLPDSAYFDVNLEGTRRLLDAAISNGVARFIYCSTIGVQGNIENPPATENHPYNPGDVYQRSKMEAEKLVLRYFGEGRISGLVIRPAMIYGPGDRRLLKLFSMIARERFFYVGKGDKHVHFIDVRDLVESFATAMVRTHLNNEVYTIAGRESVTLKEAVEIICRKLQVRKPWLHVPVKPMQILGDIIEAVCTPLRINPPIYRRRVDFFTKNRHFDCSKAKRDLDFFPKRSLEEEISDIIESYQQEGLLPLQRREGAVMLRTVDGQIWEWNRKSEETYGFSRSAAVGSVSHSLLKTEFPCALEDINQQLIKSGAWEGELVHTTQNGERLKVRSMWRIEGSPESNGCYVMEVNQPDSGEGGISHSISARFQRAVGSLIYPISEIPGLTA